MPKKILYAAWGVGGVDLDYYEGSVTIAEFPWQPYTDATLSNTWPRGVYDSRGLYRIGLSGLGGGGAAVVDIDIFDLRVFDWCLTDNEIDRVHLNSVLEIQRRGIPRWRSP